MEENEFEQSEEALHAYDFHLLSGHFLELESTPADLIKKTILEADNIKETLTLKKGEDKSYSQINALIKYSSALALLDKCVITDVEGLFSFICVRHPELELDWKTLQGIISASAKEITDYSEQKKTALAVEMYTSAIKERINKITSNNYQNG